MLNLEEPIAIPSQHEQIIESLRAEMQEYGGLLNLFDRQQDAIQTGNTERLDDLEQAIDAQHAAARARRAHRENLVAALTPDADTHPTLLQSILLFPQPMRPLIEALAAEVNRLLGKVRRRAQQVQSLHARTIEDSQDAGETPESGGHESFVRDGRK